MKINDSPHIILVDMDGVLANFVQRVWQEYEKRFHPLHIPMDSLDQFMIEEFLSKKLGDPQVAKHVQTIYNEKGFFANLEPISGAIDAIQNLITKGHEIVICTTPLLSNRYCVYEKIEWVERYFGIAVRNKMVQTKDKSLVVGSILIDDHPMPVNAHRAQWSQVVFDQPYNKNILDLPRITWDNLAYEKIINELLEQKHYSK